jgi:hypothetical protein
MVDGIMVAFFGFIGANVFDPEKWLGGGVSFAKAILPGLVVCSRCY